MKTEAYIVAAKRTPIGGFLGSLSSYSAPALGAIAVKAALESIPLDPKEAGSIYFGNVLSAGLGQSPARQVSIFSGIPEDKDATTINKVCASGMKATIIGAQQLELGLEDVVVTGGMESMSNTPHYIYLRNGTKAGHSSVTDGMLKDRLWDVYKNIHMGNAAELGVKKYNLSRGQLDEYALRSYRLAQEATKAGKFREEIVPVEVKKGKETFLLTADEDIDKVIPEKMPLLAPVFEKDGSLTAANSSNLNDGAAALVLASAAAVKKYNLKPLARIAGYADAAQAPEWFTTAPALAIPKALKHAGIQQKDIDFFEINEAYASVILSNQILLDLDLDKVNIHGGAVAMGHPIGASGARIIVTLLHILQQQKGKYGVAAICNGGGGATAIVIENFI